MLVRLRCGDDLLAVRRVRRRQHHGVDLRVGEQFLVAFHQPDALLLAIELGGRGRARRAGDEADDVARALDRRNQIAAPRADADDACADHEFGARVVIIPGRTSLARQLVVTGVRPYPNPVDAAFDRHA